MSTINDLELEWQTAEDGFVAGNSFKVWLANQVLALRRNPTAEVTEIEEVERLRIKVIRMHAELLDDVSNFLAFEKVAIKAIQQICVATPGQLRARWLGTTQQEPWPKGKY